jgi:hypothetical protein
MFAWASPISVSLPLLPMAFSIEIKVSMLGPFEAKPPPMLISHGRVALA